MYDIEIDFYVAVVRRFNDSVFQVADGQIKTDRCRQVSSAFKAVVCSVCKLLSKELSWANIDVLLFGYKDMRHSSK